MPYYFAYGSNMDYPQMKERCPNAKYYGKGYLPDYRLAFTRFSPIWDSAVADILVSPGDIVWGIIYTVSEEDLQKLDAKEGHPTYYRRKRETVMRYKTPDFELDEEPDNSDMSLISEDTNNLQNYIPFEVDLYEVVEKNLTLVPKLDYLVKLQDAAFEYSFPKDYQEKLHRFGFKDYNEKLQNTLDAFLNYQLIIENGKYPAKLKKQEEWGGANLVITGEQSRKDQLNREYPHDLVVLTPHWKVLSWLVETVYWDNKIAWQVDYTNKHYVLGELGEAALEYQHENPNDNNQKGICLAVLYRAYRIFTSDFYKMY